MRRAVLDSSVVLALLKSEPVAEDIAAIVADGVLTTVNATEVIGTLMTAGFRAEQARAALDAVGCRIVPFEKPAAILAGELRPLTRHLGLSLGDRACLATARQFGLPAATADRDWAKLEIGIEVWVIR